MAPDDALARYRRWYARLLRLYSKPYYERFGEGMAQTFSDLLRERAREGKGLFGYALWMFAETSAGIVRENLRGFMMQKKNILRIALATAVLLQVPLVAMLFTDEVAWDVKDFIFAGVLLFGTGLTYELVTRKMARNTHRIAVGVALGAALLLVWANAAVGLIGSEDEPANAMYAGVIAVAVVGAIIARLRPYGMSWALFATAFAMSLVAVIALVAGMQHYPGSSVAEILMVTGFFVALFILSALLFRRARAK